VHAPAHEGPVTLWVPLLDGAERIGVLELVLAAAPTPQFEDEVRSAASLVAELVVTRDAYSDVFSRLRRPPDPVARRGDPVGAAPPAHLRQ
jgi:hypothetical protein